MTQQNSANRKDIRRAEKDERSSEQETKSVLQNLCSSAAGRRWLWNTLSECHIFSTTFRGDVNQMLFAEGERNQGLKLLADITRYCPDTFTLMMQEAQERDGRTTPDAGADGSGGDLDREFDDLGFGGYEAGRESARDIGRL